MDRRGEKQMAEMVLKPLDEKVNRNAKDSVFVDLFGHPEYLLQLYRVLHPEDTETAEEDLTIVTLESLLLKERYNDLGFLAGNRLMVLLEAQSTWGVNIVVRFLLYVAETYNRYIEKNELDLYTTRAVELPVPELYVIYTGDKKSCPQTISLKYDIFKTENSAVDVVAKVIRDSRKGDIIYQYIAFTRIFDEQIRLNGRTRRAVEETLRLCREQDVLATYLKEKEVANIMFTFLDKEKQLDRMLQRERREAREKGLEEGREKGLEEGREKGLEEGREKGLEEGREKGREEGIIDTLISLVKKGLLTITDAASQAGMTESAFQQKMSNR